MARSAFVAGSILSIITGCSRVGETPASPTPTPQLLRSKAQGWTGENAAIRALGYDEGDGKLFLAEGSIAADGAFEVILPVLGATSEALHSPRRFFSCNGGQKGRVTTLPSALEVALLAGPDVFMVAGNPEGELFRTGLERNTYIRAEKLYASVSGTVRGTCTYSGAALTETVTFDLALNAGWNDIVRSSTFSPGRSVDLTRTGNVPKSIDWTYGKYTPPPGSSPQ